MKRAAIALAFALWGTAGLAQEPAWYVGASLGGSTSSACDELRLGVSCEDGVTNLKVFAGYQLNRNLAVEAGYINTLVKSGAHATSSSAGTFPSELRSRALDFVLMPSLPLGASASLYGKLGFYLANTEQTNTTVASGATCCVRVGSSGSSAEESNLGLTFGLGLAWNFTRNLAARADWQRYPGVGGDRVREVDVDMLHAGLLYRF